MRTPLLLAAAALGLVPTAPPTSPAPLRGFTAQSAPVERDWEAKFDAIPDPARIRANMKLLSARPHHVGSPYDKQNAEWILAQYKSWGWDAHIENFDVLFPTPTKRLVELVAPTRFKAKLEEPTVAVDPTSSQHAEQLPSYNAYSADGDVTGPLVFVNQGIPADYDELARHGISVKGAIVIAKYGGSWRGIKPKVAAEHGAIGCLIYSDPADDGYAAGGVFPNGPMRPADGVQRGSVADMPTYPGDPLTPGVGATKDAKRLPLKDAQTHHQDSGIADLIWRRQAAPHRARRPGRPARLARRPADHVSPWPRTGARASRRPVRLELEDAVRRHREAPGHDRRG